MATSAREAELDITMSDRANGAGSSDEVSPARSRS